MRGWMAVLALVGCSGTGTDDGPTDEGSPTDSPSETDTTETDTPTVTEDISAGLSGTITGTGGPLADVDLRLCRGLVCRNGLTDGGGAFDFPDVVVDWHSFEIVGPSGYATAFAPLRFDTDQHRTVDVTLVPATAHEVPATRGAVQVAPGVHLTVGEGDLEPPTPFDPAPSEITGAAVPEAAWMPVDEVPGTVLGVWYLGPFDTPAAPSAGLPIAFDNTWALADTTTLRVYVGSYLDSAWVDAGTVTVTGTTISGDAALPHLSTVLLVQE